MTAKPAGLTHITAVKSSTLQVGEGRALEAAQIKQHVSVCPGGVTDAHRSNGTGRSSVLTDWRASIAGDRGAQSGGLEQGYIFHLALVHFQTSQEELSMLLHSAVPAAALLGQRLSSH